MTEEERLENELRQGTQSLRWIILALIFIFLTIGGEFISLIMFLTENAHWISWAVGTIGCLILALYCRKMSDLSKPKSWK